MSRVRRVLVAALLICAHLTSTSSRGLAAQERETGGTAESEVDLSMERDQSRERHAVGYGDSGSLITMHGFADLDYSDFDGKNSGFDLHHANLFISGQVAESMEAYIEVEYEHSSETIELDQAEMRFRPLEDRDFTIAAGRFYAPFGIERNTWYPSSNPLVSRPMAFREVVPGNWYETGIRCDYRHEFADSFVRAEIGFTNGLGDMANTQIRKARQFRDNNNNSAIIGRVSFGFDEGPAFGFSGANMKYNMTDEISFVGVDAEWQCGPTLLRAEWVRSSLEDSAGPVGSFRREGFYALASYALWRDDERSLDVAVRLGELEANDSVDANDDLTGMSFGIRYRPHASAALKFEFQTRDARHGLKAATESGVQLQIVLDF